MFAPSTLPTGSRLRPPCEPCELHLSHVAPNHNLHMEVAQSLSQHTYDPFSETFRQWLPNWQVGGGYKTGALAQDGFAVPSLLQTMGNL